jgi:hypothetical protein
VGQHIADIDLAPVEMDGSDQPVFVPANIEHDEVANFVRRWESGSHSLKGREVMPLHDFEPPGKSTFAVGVLLPKLA